jgi:hypothetical protein
MHDLSATHAIVAGAAVVLAARAWFADRRRMRRSDPDAVGFMPWTAIFFVALLAACILIGLAAREWFAG